LNSLQAFSDFDSFCEQRNHVIQSYYCGVRSIKGAIEMSKEFERAYEYHCGKAAFYADKKKAEGKGALGRFVLRAVNNALSSLGKELLRGLFGGRRRR
jgi:hypothetical protein